MKVVYIEAMFPELRGKNIYHNARAEGSNWPVAAYRAIKLLKKGIGRYRITSAKLTLMIYDKMETEDGKKN